jgi:phage tail protein X
MRHLDYDKHDEIVRKYYGDEHSARAVGKNRRIDSGYIDIVRFFGPGAVDPSNVGLCYDSQPFTFSDSIIARFAAEIAQMMRSEGRLYDGLLVTKLKAADLAGEIKSLTLQPVDYALQAGSCLALDLEHSLFANSGGTLRSYWKSNYPGTAIESNPLPICLGVCGFLAIKTPYGGTELLCQRRSGRVTSLESSVGTSVAGLVDWNPTFTTLTDLIHDAMNREIVEEIGLAPGEYSLVPLAYAREIFRGERPQIFCLITSELSQKDIETRLGALRPTHSEHDSSFWMTIARDHNASGFASLNHEARMNYYLLEEIFAR